VSDYSEKVDAKRCRDRRRAASVSNAMARRRHWGLTEQMTYAHALMDKCDGADSAAESMKKASSSRESEWGIRLTGGRTTADVVRVGDTVRRPLQARATFVHALLRHLEKGEFGGAPRFLGIDDAGREILSFIPGAVPSELGHFSDEQLVAAARLLRELHDATADSALSGGHEVVCHGDASPCNCVFVEGMPTAFIDFDQAHAGSRLEDLGYASWLWIDIGNDELSVDLQGRRIADFVRNYGVDVTCAVDAIMLAQVALSDRTSDPGVRQWSNDCRDWVANNYDALIAAIAAHSDE
jgi:phosphotransferase family enzyme